MNRVKVAVVHPRLASGGSEARALWALQALKRDYDVTLVTEGRVDVGRLNQYYGTSLNPKELSIREVRMPFILRGTSKFAALRGAFFQRYLKRVSREFDVMISAYNPCDFGAPGIQFIGDFSFVAEWRTVLHPALQEYRQWWYGESPLRRAYLALCRYISKANPGAWKPNVTVANSHWSAGLLRQEFGIEARTLYPPVTEDFPAARWEERDDGFVCVGRVVPEKRMDAIIRILGKVREKGHNVHLHILGELDSSPYARQLKQLATENQDWVNLEGRTFGDRKRALLVGHRYGINACVNEAFGIAVAEMVKAGCIVFVPKGGGQTEIANHSNLIYENDEDAVNKIDAVLRDRQMQESLSDHLRVGAERFSADIFAAGILAITREFIESRKPAGN